MFRVLAPLVVLVAAAAVVVATDRPRPRADFVFTNHTEINTLDPQKMSWMQDLRAAGMLYEGLVRSDLLGAERTLRPGVAERWEISEDGRTYTFHLRADARWSNGEPVRASDFVYTWRRALMPDTACDYTAVFQLIEGGKEFFDWRQRQLDAFRPGDDAAKLWERTERMFDEMVRLRAVDERTLRFTLRRRVAYFLDLCAFGVFSPVYPALVGRYETPDAATGRLSIRSGWTKPGVLVSNGPFVLTGWRYKRDMDFARNPDYWDARRINFRSVRCVCIEDPSAQVLACRSGAIDWLSDVSAPYRPELLADKEAFCREHQKDADAFRDQGLDPTTIDRLLPDDPRNRIHAFPAFGTYFYSFNCRPKLPDGRDNPFADPRVRRAFALAIDKARIAGQVRRIGERPAPTLIPPGSIPGYESPEGLGRDPALAKTLLTEAGFPAGRGLPTIQILYTRDAGHEFIAQSAKKDWEEILGVSVELSQKEVKVFKQDLRNGNFMVARSSWYGDYGDPATFLDISRTGDGNNDRGYSSAEFDGIMARADAEPDPGRRMDLLHDAERLIVEKDLPILPIFQYVELCMYDPHRLTGITSHPRQEQRVDVMDILGDGVGADTPRERPAIPRLPKKEMSRRRGDRRRGGRSRHGREGATP
jgi:oligopeptide transport system substrate-binding protein